MTSCTGDRFSKKNDELCFWVELLDAPNDLPSGNFVPKKERHGSFHHHGFGIVKVSEKCREKRTVKGIKVIKKAIEG